MKRDLTEELVLDRPQRQFAAPLLTSGGIKTVLLHLHDDDEANDRLQFALSLARACGAHLHCLHVTPIEAYSVVDSFGGTFVSQEIADALQGEAAKLRDRIESHLRMEDVAWDYEEVMGELMPHLIQEAALADLVMTGREPSSRDFQTPSLSLIGDMLDKIRTPLLITGGQSRDYDPFAPAVVAWNGSYEAANAVRAALPLLKLASDVHVVEFAGEKGRRFPSTAVLEYLSRHGVPAEIELAKPSDELDRAIIRYALRKGARSIVIGGYSHSRAGEFLFGGVTRALLKDCPLALVMAR